MPLKHGPKRRSDRYVYRLIIVGDSGMSVPTDIAYSRDKLKAAEKRNVDHGNEVIIERAELPDLDWERVP